MNILIVDDDPLILDGLKAATEFAGHTPSLAATGREAWSHLQANRPDLVLLDIRLPDETGINLLERLRADAAMRHVPVVMLTSMHDIDVKLQSFALGIDDYICKPFDTRELLARIESVGKRRAGAASPQTQVTAGTTYDQVDRLLKSETQSVRLTTNEDRLFRTLLSRNFATVPKAELMELIWQDRTVGNRNLDTLVTYLRKKLAPFSLGVRADIGIGYRLEKTTPGL